MATAIPGPTIAEANPPTVYCGPFTRSYGYDCLIKETNSKLLAEGIQDGTNQQCTEQALCHCTQRIDSISLERKDNIFFLQKHFDFAHVIHFSFIIDTYHAKKETLTSFSQP